MSLNNYTMYRFCCQEILQISVFRIIKPFTNIFIYTIIILCVYFDKK